MTAHIHVQNREQEYATYDTNDIYDTSDDFSNTIEGSIFEDVIEYNCLTCEINTD